MKATIQPETRTIPAGEFKAKCLKLMDEAVVTQKPFTITKRGKAVGKFVPEPKEEKPFYSIVGRSPGIKILGDIVSPLPQEWTLPEWAWGVEEKIGQEDQESQEKVNGYLLDTHAWVWIIRGSSDEVSKRFFSEVEDWQRQGLAYLSPISCWELGLLVAGSQILLDQPIEALWERDTSPDAFRIAELTAPILVESTRLPGDLHRDPSDRILAATARANG